MTELLLEQEDLWTHLQKTEKPVVIYGMGDGALKIMRVLEQYQIPLRGIFASDGFVRGHSFEGFPVKRLVDMEEEFGDFIILMAFAIHDEPTTEMIHRIAEKHEFYAPDVPVAGENLFTMDFYREHQAQFEQVYEWLADEQSRIVYKDILNFKVSGKLNYLTHCETPVEEAYANIIKPDQQEDYVDLGAYKGDTIQELLRFTDGQVHSVCAFEPDRKNYKKLCLNVETMGLTEKSKLLNVAAYKESGTMLFSNKAGRQSALSKTQGVETPVDSLDNVMAGARVSFINMDVEGGEKEAIEGCRKTIEAWKPTMLISAYHRSEDLYALPLQIRELCPAYRFYFRHYRYIPAWDTNLYCVPEKKD
ncbi:MAG: FkbM family methyltransferase [Oscillospiraceae bacterium]|nr:FkbM family methyltransferase [Oscillospiraceae bacterium]